MLTIHSWRWGLWEIVWLTGPIMVLFIIAFPETSAENILRRRAQRLRKITGRNDLKAQTEIDQANLKFSEVFWDALIKPIEIFIKDPAITFTNIYTSLTYGIYYSFFEVFPLVYPKMYGFNLGETGLVFLSIGAPNLTGFVLLRPINGWTREPKRGCARHGGHSALKSQPPHPRKRQESDLALYHV